MPKRPQIRQLDIMFRDSLIQDCHRLGRSVVDIFQIVGPDTHIRRWSVLAIVKKWALHINKTYPGSVSLDPNHLTLNKDYIEFMAHHIEAGTDECDRRKAWASIRSILNDAR